MPEENNYGLSGRFGYVSAYDAKAHKARVKFPDLGDLISGWLPVGIPNTKSNKDEIHLDIDEHVFVVCLGEGIEDGIILCSLYDDENLPENGDENTRFVKFSDGTTIYYDREKHKLHAANTEGSYITMCEGKIEIHAPDNVNITSGRIDLN